MRINVMRRLSATELSSHLPRSHQAIEQRRGIDVGRLSRRDIQQKQHTCDKIHPTSG